jgi:cell division septation protein DedD
MAQDFAKRKQTAGGKKAPARKPQTRRKSTSKQPAKTSGSGWRWYGTGVLTGFFMAFLLYLGTLSSPGTTTLEPQSETQAAQEPPRPRFDFYTLLPGQTMDVEVEPAPEVANPRSNNTPTEFYLLQAGSFRQQEDAERRRAELLLLGLEPKVEDTSGDNGRWFRVYVGPFGSHSKMAKARSLTANQNIDTLLLKRSKP